MNALARWRTNLVFAVAGGAAFAGLLILASPPGPDEDHVAYGITKVVLSLPWLVATGVLWRAWWLRIGVRLSTLDAPARLLAMAVTTLPADRREWAAAMTAELTQIPLRGDRWRFAAGCARAAVFPPRGHRLPVVAVAAIVTVTAIVTARAVDATLPGLRVFALTFVLLLGVLTAVAVARSRRLRWPRLGLGIAGLVAVAAAIAVTVLNLHAAAVLDTGSAVTLGVILAAFLWLTITPARAPAGRRIGAGIAVGTALLLGGGLLLAARTGDGVLFYLMLAPVPAIFLGSLVVALAARSFGAGLRAGVSSIVLTGLVAFVVLGAYALRIGQPSILDGDAGSPGVNDGTVWALLNLPLWTLPFGIIGAGIGAVAGASRDPDTVRPA